MCRLEQQQHSADCMHIKSVESPAQALDVGKPVVTVTVQVSKLVLVYNVWWNRGAYKAAVQPSVLARDTRASPWSGP